MNRFPGFFMGGEDMKAHRSLSGQRLGSSLVFFSAICYLCLLVAGYVGGETASVDNPISLTMENRPLGEVLDAITEMTGHTFSIDEQWRDLPVSVSADRLPLYKVLKLLFANLNNAIIYKSDGNIKIMIYSTNASSDTGSASQSEGSMPARRSSPAMEQEGESSEPDEQESETEEAADSEREAEPASGEEQESEPEEESEEKGGANTEQTAGEQEPGEATEETSGS